MMLHFIAADAAANPVNVELISLITTIAIFLVFFLAAAWLVWPKILAGLDDRERKILKEIESAEAARAEAAESLARQEAALHEARREAKAMREQAKADAETYARDLRSQAEAELEALRKQAHREMDSAREAAISDLSNHAASLATAVASRIIGRELTADDQQDLVTSSLKEMAIAAAG